MVIVAVAEHDRVRPPEVDAEFGGVGLQRHALPGVEEHAVRAGVEPIGEPVFTEEARAANRVFGKKGECDHIFLAVMSIRQ
jgi:hypothetical protein